MGKLVCPIFNDYNEEKQNNFGDYVTIIRKGILIIEKISFCCDSL